jgi:hypothetical protein|tara:strand:+ start:698 stop:1786 length:1089 start_codon:yes stop_codon:yes gene_type:complete
MVMRTAVLHIGMHKTGSTSIQNTLKSREWTEHHFVRTRGSNHSQLLRALFDARPITGRLVQKGHLKETIPDLIDSWRQQLDAEFRTLEKPTIVLSAEGLPELSAPCIEAVRDYLMERVDRVSVVGYARAPVSLIQSDMLQKIRSGNLKDFNVPRQHYRSQFEKFDTVFGRENVDLIKFDRSCLDQGDVVVDFARRIGLVLQPEDIIHRNLSLSLEAAAVLYARNKFGVDLPGSPVRKLVPNRIVKSLEALGSTKFQLSSRALQPALDEMSEDIDWLENRLGQSMRDVPSDHPDCLSSEKDLLAIADAQVDAVRSLFIAELNNQPRARSAVAESLYQLQFLHVQRQAFADERKKRRVARAVNP